MGAVTPLVWDLFDQTRTVVFVMAALAAVFTAIGVVAGLKRWSDFVSIAGAVFLASVARPFAEWLGQ